MGAKPVKAPGGALLGSTLKGLNREPSHWGGAKPWGLGGGGSLLELPAQSTGPRVYGKNADKPTRKRVEVFIYKTGVKISSDHRRVSKGKSKDEGVSGMKITDSENGRAISLAGRPTKLRALGGKGEENYQGPVRKSRSCESDSAQFTRPWH